MEDYITKTQFGWDTSKPVLQCCINSESTKGYCQVCMENFKYRSGSYYDGFIYPNDSDLLLLMSSGNKPFATFARRKRDKILEREIKKYNLSIVRKYRNKWSVLQYDVVKNPKLRLSHLGDLDTINKLLDMTLSDQLIIDLPKIENLPRIYSGLLFGYPFYTLTLELYKTND